MTLNKKNINLEIKDYDVYDAEFAEIVNYLITNLQVMSKISETDKLSFYEEHLSIDTGDSYLQGVYRWWNYSNRENTITELTSFLDKFNTILNYLEKKLDEYKKLRTLTAPKVKRKQFIRDTKFTITEEIPSAISGLENLKLTYKDDEKFTDQINVIIKGLKNYQTQS